MLNKTILHYKVVEKLGEGGMGVVYKAKDTKLKRTVALKFLPPQTLAAKDDKSRFMREAQAAAALNHPNIATVYAIDEHEEQMFIAMEFIEGESLKEKIAAAPLKLKKVIDYATQIAEGLKAAHEKGVVHRDIKSQNIMVTNNGQIKIMDFGLAKLAGGSMLTKQGMTMGTINYMSPEQAQGEKVDHRSDIWSLGVVMYEMITGQHPFKGDYEQALVYAIMNQDPEHITALRSGVPMELERIVFKALAKDPDYRYQSVNEIPVDLRGIEVSSKSTSQLSAPASRLSTIAPAAKPPSRVKQIIPWILVFAMAALAGFSFWRSGSISSKSPTRRLIIPTESPLSLSNSSAMDISPDGSNIVYVGKKEEQNSLFLRDLNKFESTPIQGSEGAEAAFFSHDGKWVGFVADGKLRKVSVFGGVPVTVCETAEFFGAAWMADNKIVFSGKKAGDASALLSVSADGGAAEILIAGEDSLADLRLLWPQALPDGNSLLCTLLPVGSQKPDDGKIALLSLATRQIKTVLPGGIHGRYLPTGHIVAVWSDGLLAVPFDLGKQQVTGPSVPVLGGLRMEGGLIPNYAFATDGSLAFVPGTATTTGRTLLSVNRQGKPQPLSAPRGDYSWPKFSSDGQQLLVSLSGKNKSELWQYDFKTGNFTTLAANAARGIWSPDGKTVTFAANDNSNWKLSRQTASGSTMPDLVSGRSSCWPSSWAKDGKLIAFCEEDENGSLDIQFADADGKVRGFLQTPANEHSPAFSPDGRWVAYVSDQSGSDEIYLRSSDGKGDAKRISINGGKWPVWHSNGKEIFFSDDGRIFSTTVAQKTKPKPKIEIALPKEVCKITARDGYFDVSPDGQRFAIVEEIVEQPATQLNLILNWFEELNRLVPSEKKFGI
jgi:serine/threonine-protein kinase